MISSAKYKSLLCGLMTLIITVAWGGKAVHTHSDSYWRSFEQTEAAAKEGCSIADNCPICHYSICYFNINGEVQPCLSTIILRCPPIAPTRESEAEMAAVPTLRGSPLYPTI